MHLLFITADEHETTVEMAIGKYFMLTTTKHSKRKSMLANKTRLKGESTIMPKLSLAQIRVISFTRNKLWFFKWFSRSRVMANVVLHGEMSEKICLETVLQI